MTSKSKSLLDRLDDARRLYGPGASQRVEKLLERARTARLSDVASLVRWHDALLFLRAFPQSRDVVHLADSLLATTFSRMAELKKPGADLSLLDDESVSGIAGGEIVEAWEFPIAQWLARKFRDHVSIDWDVELNELRLANTLPRVIPLLDEDATVEPDVDWRSWIDAARGPQNEVEWLTDGFSGLDLPERQKSELYESLELPIRLDLQDLPITRTCARRVSWDLYLHEEPLLQRKDVSLDRELSCPLQLRKLPEAEGAEIIDLARGALTVRYRGLHGMTWAAQPVYEAAPGRGLQIFLWGIQPDRRLPLRAYACGITLKNGVPINYLEAIALFDWVEVGFNTYYAFREGETAWVYAQVLRALRPLLGFNVVSVYPYQIGYQNEEAIESGAFWFYRKMGFRPGRPDLAALCEKEEKKIAKDKKHRTSARNLRRFAEGHMFYELPGTPKRTWDRFRTRYLGIAVNQHVGKNFYGNTVGYRSASSAALAKTLSVSLNDFHGAEHDAFDAFATALHSAPEISQWSADERAALLRIIQAKCAPEEWEYLRLLREHIPLRDAFLRLGSKTA